MKRSIFLLIGATAASACGDGGYPYGYGWDSSEIVFGIVESTDQATGEATTRAGYEYLGLANKGGWATVLSRSGEDGTCIYEDLDRRIGRPHVGDGGRARWVGGTLPPEGLVVNANEPDPELAGRAFVPGKPLAFDIDFGFGLPEIPAVPMHAPRTELTTIEPPAGELSVDAASHLAFAWRSGATPDLPSNVMVALDTEDETGRGAEVRCFFDEKEGRGAVPPALLQRLGASGTKGTVRIATHRQVTVIANGGWLVYVVGAIVHREQPFVIR